MAGWTQGPWGRMHACTPSQGRWPLPHSVIRLCTLDCAVGWQGLNSPLTTPLVTSSFLSNLKPFYSTEENNELMDISIHSVISLQPPAEDNESVQVGPSGPPHFLGQDLEVYNNLGSAESALS